MAQRLAIPPTAFRSQRQRKPRITNEHHLRWIRRLTCCIAADCTGNVEAAHIRFASPLYAKRQVGLGERPNDRWVIPLCSHHHRAQHAHGDERDWWVQQSIDPVAVASALWGCSGDLEAAELILHEHRSRHTKDEAAE